MRLTLLGFAAAAVLAGCRGEESASSRASSKRPNVLLFLVDTLRADALGAYGNTIVETPAIDRFASEGTLFERAFAPTSWTRPSVTSILTGLHPSVHGVERRGSALPSSVAVLPEILRDHGYRTGFLATNPNVGSFFGYARGFDDFIELYERREQGVVELGEFVVRSDRVIDRAKDWMEESERPFFLVVFVIDPHSPYDPPPDFDRYTVQSLDDSRHGPRDPRPGLYYGEVAFVDECFGRLMAYLEDRGITEETISIFASDHGEEFFDHGKIGHGKNLYDESLHVPLLLRWPGKIASGRRVGTPVELMDLMSTILELTGLAAPPIQDGRSLLDESAERPPFLASLKLDGQREWSIRDYPWKLIVEGRTVKLFDLSKDPDELRDLSSEHPDVARELGRWVGKREEIDRERGLLARQGRPPGEAPAGELSEDAEKALRELGYIQ